MFHKNKGGLSVTLRQRTQRLPEKGPLPAYETLAEREAFEGEPFTGLVPPPAFHKLMCKRGREKLGFEKFFT